MLTELLRHLRANSIKTIKEIRTKSIRALLVKRLNSVGTSPLEGRELAFLLSMLK